MADIQEIVVGDVVPMVPADGRLYYTGHQSNVDGIQVLTYGTLPPTGVIPHDHGQGRGELLDRSLVSMSYGPYADTGAPGDAEQGIPLYRLTSGSYATTPKLVAAQCVLVLGNVGGIKVTLAGKLSPTTSAQTVTLTVELRPLGSQGRAIGAAGPAKTITLSTGVGQSYDTSSALFTETEVSHAAGPRGLDREVELCIWLTSDPAPATAHRLLCMTAYATSLATSMPLQPVTLEQLPSIEPPEVQDGRPIITSTLIKGKARINGAIKSALGLVPGYAVDGTEDDSAPWQRVISSPHQHTGRALGDGACLRHGMWSQTYTTDMELTAGTMSSSPYYGLPLTDNRGIASEVEGRVTLPEGLGSFSVRFAALCSLPEIACRVSVFVYASTTGGPSTGTQLATLATQGMNSSQVFGGWLLCAVEAAPDGLYMSPQQLAATGTRPWGTDALLPTILTGLLDRDVPYRISEPLKVSVSVPTTGIYRVRLRIEMREVDGDLDPDAVLQWLAITPDFGY